MSLGKKFIHFIILLLIVFFCSYFWGFIKLPFYGDKEAIGALSKLKFNNLQIPVYAEMITGLPGETYESWINGLGYLLDSNINNQIFVYQAEVYPNTELNEEAYKKKHKILGISTALLIFSLATPFFIRFN